MRLTLLAIIFLLILTLVNAYIYRKGLAFVAARNYAGIQITDTRSLHRERDAFVWREIGAVVITIIVFGAIASSGKRRST